MSDGNKREAFVLENGKLSGYAQIIIAEVAETRGVITKLGEELDE